MEYALLGIGVGIIFGFSAILITKNPYDKAEEDKEQEEYIVDKGRNKKHNPNNG